MLLSRMVYLIQLYRSLPLGLGIHQQVVRGMHMGLQYVWRLAGVMFPGVMYPSATVKPVWCIRGGVLCVGDSRNTLDPLNTAQFVDQAL